MASDVTRSGREPVSVSDESQIYYKIFTERLLLTAIFPPDMSARTGVQKAYDAVWGKPG